MIARTFRGLAVGLAAALLLATGPASAGTTTPEVDDARLLLLLDASRSMEDPDADGDPKIDTARAALRAVIDDLDGGQQVGLRVFGGQVELDRPMADKCTDSHLVVPIDTDNADDLRAGVEDYAPLGETPIAYALQQAADDLGPEGNRTIVLVSDGIATCDPDPCEVAEELSADGLDLVVHTVGLGADETTRSQLQCIAESSGGTYYDATEADTLTTALTRIANRAFRPFSIQGEPVRGSTDPAQAPTITAGQYTDTIGVGDQPKWYTVSRSTPGTGVHVGIASQPPFGETSMVEIRFETMDGQLCGFDRSMASTFQASSSVVAGAAYTPSSGPDPSEDGPCQTEQQLRMALMLVGNYAGEGNPIEFVVEETPALAEAPLPEMPALAEFVAMDRGTSLDTVDPGTSFNDAPALASGRAYELEMMPGEVLFFTVPVEYGQAAQARLDYDPADVPQRDLLQAGIGPFFNLDFLGPDRGQILNLVDGSALSGTTSTNSRLLLADQGPASAVASTGQVRPSNRGRADAPFLAGDHYLMLSLTPSRSTLTVPVTLTVQVVGDAVEGPVLADAQPADASGQTEAAATTSAQVATRDSAAERTDTPDGTAASLPTNDADEGGSSSAAWVLGGVGAALAAAGALVLATRGRNHR